MSGAVAAVACASFVASASAHASKNPCAEFFQALPASPIPESVPLDPAVTGMFAVLRRPATAEDQVPPFNPLNDEIGFQLRSYLPAYIRQLTREGGDRYFLITGFERSFLPPAKCLPEGLRRRQRRFEEQERRRERLSMYCVVDIGSRRPGYDASSCQPFAAVQSGSRLFGLAKSTSDVVELVPDGVTSVRLTYRGGTVVGAPVANNAFTFTPPQRPIRRAERIEHRVQRQLFKAHGHAVRQLFRRFFGIERRIRERLQPQTVEWLGAAGQTLRSFRPKPEAGLGGVGENVLTIS